MAAQVYTFDHTQQLIREFAAGAFPLKMVLLDSAYIFDQTDTLLSEVSGDEITGTNYTAGGNALTGLTVLADGSIDSDDILWTTLTATFRFGVIYYNGTLDGKLNPVLFAYLFDDTPADQVIAAATFQVVINAGGLV